MHIDQLLKAHTQRTIHSYYRLYFFSTWKGDVLFTSFQCLESFVSLHFPKKLYLNMIFLALSKKMIFLFPENMILFFRRKLKDDLSQKYTWKYGIFRIFSKDGTSFSYIQIWYYLSVTKGKMRWHFRYHWKRWYSS